MKLKFGVAAAALLLAACAQLPRELRTEIEDANRRLAQSVSDFNRTNAEVEDDLRRTPGLFSGTAVATAWPAALQAAKAKLDAAGRDRGELEKLLHSSGKQAEARARQLLADQDALRQSAIDSANAIQAQANRWLDFQKNLPYYLGKMKENHDSAHAADLSGISAKVAKAELDWPNKKDDLERRITLLKTAPDRAESAWNTTAPAREAAAAGKVTGPQIAALIDADAALSDAAHPDRGAAQLDDLTGQLYNSWDKILEDLDTQHGSYREKVKLINTRFTDVASHQTKISTDAGWVDVSPAQYRAVEDDLGMAIAHKDAGLYDSEVVTVAQPPGFAYIAPPSAGRNQYGYWSNDGGSNVWHWLPEYLIMRELFWGPSYRPVVLNEYNGYYAAQRLGHTYYGETTPAAPPRYGTHGTFTQQRYAGSRYVQSGGFKSSGYAAHPSAAPPSASPQPHFGDAPSDSSAGKRFGNGSNKPPAGKRFGGSSRPSGKSFGRRR
ncbi:MAG: hypothetical protein KGN84_05190 [Acidobacteriota bacterium]|nr:hypothetical protein [Acidobacteriota bacterium]